MTIFHRVIVPVDFSEASRSALHYAVKLAEGSETEIVLLHVVQPVVPTSPDGFIPQGGAAVPYQEEFEDARQQLAGLELLATGAHCRTLIRTGDPGPEIVACANEEKADLIVMSTHGRTGLARLLLGSTSEKVMRTAEVPLLTLRHSSHVPVA